MAQQKTSCCFNQHCLGQASVEAAVLMPTVLVIMALLIQPICLLYTKTLMHGAAAEVARAALTAREENDLSSCRAYVLRRLAAIPEVSIFHVGGANDWQVDVSEGSSGSVSVVIAGHVRPLPLFATVVGALEGRDSTGVVLRVEVNERMRPSWLGGGYSDWISIWE